MWIILSLLILSNQSARADDTSQAESVNIDAIKQKYWARGDETELGVVQNRAYSKGHRFELGAFGGVTFSDPFLSTNQTGLDLGYHFTENLGLHLIAWKSFVSPSSALDTFEREKHATTNTNYPKNFVGVEGMGSVLYGKLSVLGKSIIYYDLHGLVGVGSMGTESGRYIAPSLGVGQRFYFGKLVSLRIDYRLMYYRETILEKQIVTQLGQPTGSRDNWSNVITLGLSFLIGGE